MMEIALLENLQREDLSIIEEAHAYKNLLEELELTQEELSEKLGKSRSHIANTVRLLTLPEIVINSINNGQLSMGHGRAILGIKRSEEHTSELQSRGHLVCRLLLEKKKNKKSQ